MRIVISRCLSGLLLVLVLAVQPPSAAETGAAQVSPPPRDGPTEIKAAALGLTGELQRLGLLPPAALPDPLREGRYPAALQRLRRADFPEILAALAGRRLDGARQAELFRARVLAAYGLPRAAARVLDDTLDAPVSASLRADSWLQVAEAFYRRGEYTATEDILAHAADELSGTVPPPAHRRLQAQAVMAAGRFERAAQLLGALLAAGDADLYTRYNLGVALLRAGRAGEGTGVLERLGRRADGEEEAMVLRDRANVTLGFSLLQQDRAPEAKEAFERVRADGMFSHQALLGLGWVEWHQRNWRRALVPWTKLQRMSPADEAVVEARAMVPETLLRLGSRARAADRYREAVTFISGQLERVEEDLGHYRDGGVAALLDSASPAPRLDGWTWDGAAPVPASVHLAPLLSSDPFQGAVGMYHDLRTIDRLLGRAELAGAEAQAVQARVRALRARARQSAAAHAGYIEQALVEALEARRAWLREYLVRTRHALARLLDDMAHRGSGD